jgi:enoyl-CoA hydratase
LAFDVHLEQDGHVARLTVDNPPVNALHPDVAAAISTHVETIAADSGIRCVVLTGTGRHFMAGGDIEYFRTLNAVNAETYVLEIQRMQFSLGRLGQPVIAAINGTTLGGGCELAMACDIRVAETHAVFGQPEVSLGIIPGAGGTQNLPRLIPTGRAKRLLFTGERINSSDALAWGLVDEVVPTGQALHRAHELAEMIARNAPLAVAAAKRAVNRGTQMSIEDGQLLEASEFAALVDTTDFGEGIEAFFAKRTPRFTGH